MASIFTPELYDPLNLPQHAILRELDGAAALRLFTQPVVVLAPLNILLDHAV
jgi:hypothetical protein